MNAKRGCLIRFWPFLRTLFGVSGGGLPPELVVGAEVPSELAEDAALGSAGAEEVDAVVVGAEVRPAGAAAAAAEIGPRFWRPVVVVVHDRYFIRGGIGIELEERGREKDDSRERKREERERARVRMDARFWFWYWEGRFWGGARVVSVH